MAGIRALRDGVLSLSAERVWSEVKRILQADDPCMAVALMQETGVMALLLPQADVGRLEALVGRGAPGDVMLRVAALLPGDAQAYAQRWKLSGAEAKKLCALSVSNFLMPDVDDTCLRRALAEEPAEILIGRSWLGQDNRPGWEALRTRLTRNEPPVFPLHGRDIAAFGVAPGPKVGEVLRRVYEWWLADGCLAGHAACRDRAAVELSGQQGQGALPLGSPRRAAPFDPR